MWGVAGRGKPGEQIVPCHECMVFGNTISSCWDVQASVRTYSRGSKARARGGALPSISAEHDIHLHLSGFRDAPGV